jgi:two-component system CheB/CheR fusion protein
MRAQTGHDFSQYKVSTLLRRVKRRMAIHQIGQANQYLQFLQKNPSETEALFRDLLIGVTHFFRDTEAFQSMESQVLPKLLSRLPPHGCLRVWVCGCSTGEEAYSFAILIREQLDELKRPINVQIFATDIDRQAIEQARTGIFPASIASDVAPNRLARFFTPLPGSEGFRIQKGIRDLLIFSEQDVLKDPPFSKLDLISCRNLLIYLNPTLQKRLIPLFHYSLRREGVLFLGSSESIGEFGSLFTPLDRKWKIFQKQSDGAVLPQLISHSPDSFPRDLGGQGSGDSPPIGGLGRDPHREMAERALLEHFSPTGALVDSRGEILHL